MYSGHETLDDFKVIVNNFGERSQTVGCARGIGDDFVAWIVRIQVHTNDEHGCVSRWRGDDDFLSTTF